MSSTHGNRAQRRRADKLQRRCTNAIEGALRRTDLEGAGSPTAAFYRVARTVEREHGENSLTAKLVRARFSSAAAQVARNEQVVAKGKTLKGRWALLKLWVAGLLGNFGALFKRTPESDAAALEVAGPRQRRPDVGRESLARVNAGRQ